MRPGRNDAAGTVRIRVVAAVCAAWLLIGVVLGSQTALGMTMQGTPIELSGALTTALINTLPWIPATLLAIALTNRFPLTRERWAGRIWVHLLAIPITGWLANVGVVLGFWTASGSFAGFAALARQATFWATIRIHVATAVYGATLLITQGWMYFRESRVRELRVARLETQLAHARLRALSEQIRPHFLFNTLHTIGQLWRSGRADDADAMLDHLGSLFQRVRSSTDHPAITLDEELAMVEEYLAIERARFADRLRVRVAASDEARGCVVPPLLLQPIVENAIRHGVSASTDAGCVSVVAGVEEDRLVVEVTDDGPGFDAETRSAGSGTGLSNTRERLEQAFGADQSLEAGQADGGGARVRLTLPAVRDPDLVWSRASDGRA